MLNILVFISTVLYIFIVTSYIYIYAHVLLLRDIIKKIYSCYNKMCDDTYDISGN